ncbi:MAG: 2-hydroxyacyl-CoA dehydratase family protein [Synergistaceae bacterium]|nr:2-hydroxyacyl-CoA dehydratase family protein [Synergistaceae bacterium]
MTTDANLTRDERLVKKTSGRAAAETKQTLDMLRARPDYTGAFDYFLELAETGCDTKAVSERTRRRVVSLLCVQAPIELIHAAGFHPLKIWSGSSAACNFASPGFPALMCPMLKAVCGAIRMNGVSNGNWVIPTTCDWVVKFPELASKEGSPFLERVFWLELPHLKDEPEGQHKWLDEIFRFKKHLENLGEKISRRSLSESIKVYGRAWRALSALSRMRQNGLLASVWFMLAAGTFFLDAVENWTLEAGKVIASRYGAYLDGARVFLAGSPIFFPNLKLPLLAEEAGLSVVADDLCSSERVIPGAVTFGDESEFGMMEALAERYHQACLCPTFIDNDRRVNNILGRRPEAYFDGVVFHVLKGCHPYDIESSGLEAELKSRGLRFIRLETDYASEDDRNLFARLEAFRNTLGARA